MRKNNGWTWGFIGMACEIWIPVNITGSMLWSGENKSNRYSRTYMYESGSTYFHHQSKIWYSTTNIQQRQDGKQPKYCNNTYIEFGTFLLYQVQGLNAQLTGSQIPNTLIHKAKWKFVSILVQWKKLTRNKKLNKTGEK